MDINIQTSLEQEITSFKCYYKSINKDARSLILHAHGMEFPEKDTDSTSMKNCAFVVPHGKALFNDSVTGDTLTKFAKSFQKLTEETQTSSPTLSAIPNLAIYPFFKDSGGGGIITAFEEFLKNKDGIAQNFDVMQLQELPTNLQKAGYVMLKEFLQNCRIHIEKNSSALMDKYDNFLLLTCRTEPKKEQKFELKITYKDEEKKIGKIVKKTPINDEFTYNIGFGSTDSEKIYPADGLYAANSVTNLI